MSEFLKTLSQLWANITTNAANTNSETWLILLVMFAVWAVPAVLITRDCIKHPEKYKDIDKFIPPH
jgi:hypothetical protein